MLYYASIVSEGLPITTVSRPGGGDSVVIGRPSGGRRADGLNKGIYGSFTGVQKKQEQSIVVQYAILMHCADRTDDNIPTEKKGQSERC